MSGADTDSRIDAAWARLQRGLERLGIAEMDLQTGASDADIAAVEAQTGLALPGEVRRFWRVHNGQVSHTHGLAGGFHFVSVAEAQKILNDWGATRKQLGEGIRDLDRSAASHPPKAIQRKYSSPGWVPLLRDDEGNYVGVDLAPGPAGAAGQIINFGRDEDEKHVLFSTAAELLEWLADEVEAKRIVFAAEDDIIVHVEGRISGVMIDRRTPPT